jgi:hypothetical protein
VTATIVSGQLGIDEALTWIAATAAERDRESLPPFPEEAIARLEAADALTFNARPGTGRPPATDELELVRAVARADGSVGRIFDGHLNGVERLAVQVPPEIRDRELAAGERGTASGRRLGC